MKAYALQKAIYDHLNARGRPDPPAIEPGTLRRRYGLGNAEIRALCEGDVATLYRLGVHPARVPHDRYRAALAELEQLG